MLLIKNQDQPQTQQTKIGSPESRPRPLKPPKAKSSNKRGGFSKGANKEQPMLLS